MDMSNNAMDNLFFDLRRLKYLGRGAIIGKTVRIRKPEECIIGDGVIIDDFAYISCSIEIGKHCHIASHVSISGGAGRFQMGEFSTISNHCSIHCASSDYNTISLDLPSVDIEQRFGGTVGDVFVGQYVTVGAHSCILPSVDLPDGSAFGAFSLIRPDDYQEFCLYAGIPASFRRVRKLPEDAPAALRALHEKSKNR
jgi:acetyltransferase-like isoleucine patch superfamily enzyme